MQCLGCAGAMGFIGLIMVIGALGGSQKKGASTPEPTSTGNWGIPLLFGIGALAFLIWVFIERRKNRRR